MAMLALCSSNTIRLRCLIDLKVLGPSYIFKVIRRKSSRGFSVMYCQITIWSRSLVRAYIVQHLRYFFVLYRLCKECLDDFRTIFRHPFFSHGINPGDTVSASPAHLPFPVTGGSNVKRSEYAKPGSAARRVPTP
jgi:hypothetical protein